MKETHSPTDTDARSGWPIAAALSIGFGLLVAVAVVIVMVFGLYEGRNTSFQFIRDKTELILTSVKARIDGHLEPAWDQAGIVADTLARGDVPVDDRRKVADFMIAALSGTPQVSEMLFVDADLFAIRVLHTGDGFKVEMLSLANDPRIIAAAEEVQAHEGPFWGEVVWSPTFGEALINLRTPIRRQGKLIGTVVSAITIADFSAYLDRYDNTQIQSVFILYGGHEVLAHPALIDSAIKGTIEKPLPDLPAVGDPVLNRVWLGDKRPPELPGLSGDLKGYAVDFGSSEYAVLYTDIDTYGEVPWRIGVEIKLENITAGLERLTNAAIAGAAVLVVALFIAFLIGRGMARPVRNLATAAREVEDLDFDEVPTITGGRFRETRDAALAFNAMLAGLRAFSIYVPRSLVRRLVRQGDVAKLPSEEREVTVMFTDIVGFTTQAEGLSPNETASFLNDHFTLLAEAVEKTDGTVDKYIGDSVMAFWGAPENQPDQAARACTTALGMVRAIEAFNERHRLQGKPPVRIRIGIHTGPAIVGNVGGPTRVDYTLVGDTVNTASRLVDLARNYMGEADMVCILISSTTASALDDRFLVEELGEESIRGRHGRVGLCRLVGTR
jgi:adenylate cyclase